MKQSNTTLRLPAEWEPQSCIQLTWPHEGTDWKPYLENIVETCVQMTDAITRYEDVLIVAPKKEKVESQLQGRLSKEQLQRVHIFTCPTNDTWARDHGPITVGDQLMDFRFNGWGEKFFADDDNLITRRTWEAGYFNTLTTLFAGKAAWHHNDNNDFVLEGGSIESDGLGTVITTSQCLLAPHRNQPMTQDDIEDQIKRRLHAERVIWLDHGNLIGDDTDGHIDTIVRMAPDDTLVYVQCQDHDDPQWEDFNQLEKQLQSLKTAEGKPYKLVPLPMPRAIYDEEDRLPATYANFLIINGAVLLPTYDQPDLDAIAHQRLQEVFADREIIDIDACTIIRQHGSIHCMTMQYPAV